MNNICNHSSRDRLFISLDCCAESMACTSCGSLVDTEFVEDPFSSEVHGDYTRNWRCPNCLYQSAMDI